MLLVSNQNQTSMLPSNQEEDQMDPDLQTHIQSEERWPIANQIGRLG